MSRTVVIALDNSDLSARALPFARAVAQQWHGRLVLVHATGRRGEQAPGPVERELQALVRSLSEEGIYADAVVRVASPARAIVDVANERNADLIVMASHQRHGLNRWLNGSVTEEVLANGQTALLVVPAHGEPPGMGTLRVLVPLDGSPVGEAALEFVRERSASRPLELVLLRVVVVKPVVVGQDASFAVLSLSPTDIEAEVREARDYLAELAATIRDRSVKARCQVIEASGSVAKVILEIARGERVDTIALGTHGKAGVSRLVLGSVSEEALERSPVPVLVVRHPAATLRKQCVPIARNARRWSGSNAAASSARTEASLTTSGFTAA